MDNTQPWHTSRRIAIKQMVTTHTLDTSAKLDHDMPHTPLADTLPRARCPARTVAWPDAEVLHILPDLQDRRTATKPMRAAMTASSQKISSWQFVLSPGFLHFISCVASAIRAGVHACEAFSFDPQAFRPETTPCSPTRVLLSGLALGAAPKRPSR